MIFDSTFFKKGETMRVVIGCDEAAYELKEKVKAYLSTKNYEVKDVGVYDTQPSVYPDIAQRLCDELLDQHYDRGLLFCGTGIGMAITANKIPGIRAAVGHDLFSVERSVKSNDCQILCMGARIIAFEYAKSLLDVWFDCEFSGGASAQKVERISAIEKEYSIR